MINQDDINKEIARKLKIDLKLVTSVNDKQWKKVKQAIDSVGDYEINVLYFGTFSPRYTVVKKRIRMLIEAIRNESKKPKNQVVDNIIADLKKQLKNIWSIKNQFAIDNIKAKKKKQNR